jgi:hypothetical protein
MRAAEARGPQHENYEKTKASKAFWAKYREGQKLLARAEKEGARLGRPPAVEIVIKQTPLLTPHLAVVTTKVADQHRLPFATFVLDDRTGEITDLSHFASVATALLRHDALVREATVPPRNPDVAPAAEDNEEG